MAEVKLEFTGEDADLMRTYRRIQTENDRLKQGMAELGRESRRSRGEMEQMASGLNSAASAATRFIGGFAGLAGIQQMMSMLERHIDAVQARADKAANVVLSKEAAEVSISRNISKEGTLEEQKQRQMKLLADARQLAVDSGVSEQYILNALSSGLSASGGNADKALSHVRMQAHLNRATPEDLAAAVTGSLSMADATGVSDPAAAQGYMEAAGAAGFVPDPRKIAKNLPVAVNTGVAFGDDPNEHTAFWAALTNAMKDPEGDVATTAQVSFTKQLHEFFNKKGADGGSDAGLKANQQFYDETGRGMGFQERVETLQNDGKLQEEFLASLSIEGKALGAIMNLLQDAASSMATSFREVSASLPRDEAGYMAMTENAKALIDAVPSVKAGDAKRSMEAANTDIYNKDADAHVRGIYSPENLDKKLEAAGVSAMGRAAAEKEYKLRALDKGEPPEDVYGSILNRHANRIEKPTELQYRGSYGGPGMADMVAVPKQATEQEIEIARVLREQADRAAKDAEMIRQAGRDMTAAANGMQSAVDMFVRVFSGGSRRVPDRNVGR